MIDKCKTFVWYIRTNIVEILNKKEHNIIIQGPFVLDFGIINFEWNLQVTRNDKE